MSSSDFVKILSPAQPAEGIETPVELFLLVVFFSLHFKGYYYYSFFPQEGTVF